MGNLFGKPSIKYQVMMVGVYNGGKSKIANFIDTPTTNLKIGFNSESVQYKDIQINFWDWDKEGYCNTYQNYLENMTHNNNGIIFVVDSTDTSHLIQSKIILDEILFDDLWKSLPLLIIANKQDLNNAKDTDEISNILGLNNIKDRTWIIKGTAAIKGTGVFDVLEWIRMQFNN
jgi:GTPase SAR1 family protein